MPQILIKNSALKRDLEEIADAFRAVRPHDYALAIHYAASASKALRRSDGMSDGGHFQQLANMPGLLYSFVKHEMRKRHGIPDFFSSKENWRLLLGVWSDLATKLKSKSVLRIRRPETTDILN